MTKIRQTRIYQVHFDDAKKFQCAAMTLEDAIVLFRLKHPDAAINQFLLVGAHKNWIEIEINQIATSERVLERVIQFARARRAAA